MECGHKFTMCRLCLCCVSESFSDIFKVNERFGYVAAEVIRDLLQLEVIEVDIYPHVVCSICLGKLTDLKQFKEQSQKSRDIYDNVFASSVVQEEHPVEIEELKHAKLEFKDPFDSQEERQGVEKCSTAFKPREYSEDIRKRTRRESSEGVEAGEIDVNVLSDDESDMRRRVEPSVGNSSMENVKRQEEVICIDTSDDASLDDEETGKLGIGDNQKAGKSEWETGEESRLGVEETEGNGNRFSCHDCGKNFPKKDVLLRHLELHGYVITEDSCGEEGDLQVNTNVSSGSKRETIDSMEKDAMGKTSNAVQRVKKIVICICDLCGKGFNRMGNLKQHLKIHSVEKPYVCSVCGKGFKTERNLQYHNQKHNGQLPYSCEVCGLNFVHKCNLTNHIRTHTGEKPYECETCGGKFTQSSSLVKHRRLHTGERMHVCNVCGVSFSRGNSLARHMRVHTGKSPYKCEVCGRSFSENFTLKIHMRSHTGERPYVCEFCGTGFADNQSLKKHRYIHTGERPHKCEVCGKAFTVRKSLREHRHIHSGVRPYACPVCNKCFSDRSTRRQHVKTHMRVHTASSETVEGTELAHNDTTNLETF